MRIISYTSANEFSKVYGSSMHFYYYQIVKHIPLFYPSNQKVINKYFLSDFNILESQPSVDKWEELSTTSKEKKATHRFISFFGQQKPKIKIDNLNACNEIINLCKQKNIEIIGLKFPISTSLSHQYDQHNLGKMIDSVLSLYQINTIINFSVPPFNNDTNLSDQDHVNAKGAKLIIKKLISNHPKSASEFSVKVQSQSQSQRSDLVSLR